MPAFVRAFTDLLAAGALWISWPGSRAPGPFRGRPCQGRIWKRAFPHAGKEELRDFLAMFAGSFRLHAGERLRFAPEDRILDVYAARYPRKGGLGVDAMELEVLALETRGRYGVDLEAMRSEHLTLGELFAACRSGERLPPR
ncbi:hypothetical protein C8246_05660 [Paracidovorax avenae]|uniref:hypothetical protein n=1 Tax=Paracidovorax avenae TaxID=80867 RepID=UPI000D1688B2|nr:hypothetical protein [Paracidovorax avenae]AVS91373.1 hypothetical protein C8246_05660 [Paracidovorax avenae]AVS98758.1 hypothetical protein C8236_07855 [Paracidovorax avenae]AVT19985.1 hypothetical protein C7Y68_08120 [Paracidovorax avenae]